MRPTREDFKPRRDGWFEHLGTWEEVQVGTVLASDKRTERWEVIATAHGPQVEYGHTLWFRVREQATGEERSIPPRPKPSTARILTKDPRDTVGEPFSLPSDAEAMRNLVEGLGAQVMATYSHETGEVHCPLYEAGHTHDKTRTGTEGLLEHLRFAHGMDTSELEALSGDDLIVNTTIVHGHAHNPKSPVGKGGFPHRHVPEDLSFVG